MEGRNFDIRKQLLEFDDVANDQRKVVYQQRNELMDVEDISETIGAIREDVFNEAISGHIQPGSLEEQWDVPGLETALVGEFGDEWPIQRWLDEDHDLHEETLRKKIKETLDGTYAEKEQLVGSENLRQFEKGVMLQTLDSHWKEHLASMDYLRQGIHLRGYAQKNPKQEYKREAFEMFTRMLEAIKHEVIGVLSKVRVQLPEEMRAMEAAPEREFEFKHEEFTGLGEGPAEEPESTPEAAPEHTPYVRPERKIGRNEPCPCGSGKKYKRCHGKVA